MKTVLLLILITFTYPAHADLFTAEYEIGLSYYLNGAGQEGIYCTEENQTNVLVWEKNVDLEVLFSGRVYLAELLFVGGTTAITVDQLYVNNYLPFYHWYEFEAGIKYNGVEIYYEHLCAHTSTTFGYKYRLLSGVDQSYDRIGIRYKGTIGR